MKPVLRLLTLLVIAATGLEFAQNLKFKGEVNLVEVYATVVDHNGRTVDGLTKDQFEIRDDGKAQEIQIFEPTYGALSCALLLDTTGSMSPAMQAVRNGARKLIETLRPEDSIGVYTFTDHLDELQEMSTDHAASRRALIQLRAGGRTAFFDSISELATDLGKKPGKKVIVILTDAGDNASVLNRESAISCARKAGVPVFAIAEGEALQDSYAANLLRELAEATGGAMYRANRSKEIETVFQAIAQFVRNGYLLGFQASPEKKKAPSWHALQVLVKNTEKPLRVKARTGYSLE